mgnify:CR=1 FL=1
MNKTQAIHSLERGYAITHKSFEDNTFVQKMGETLIDEDGQHLPEDEFWEIRTGGNWENNWRIHTTSKFDDAKLYLKSFHGLDVEHSMSAIAFEYDIYDRNRIGDDPIDDWERLTEEEVMEIAEELKAKSLPQPDPNEDNLNELPVADTLEDERFPNGFEELLEAHFHIAQAIGEALMTDELDGMNEAHKVNNEFGIGGLYDMARLLAIKFENKYKNVEWGTPEFIYPDIMEEFIKEEIYTFK